MSQLPKPLIVLKGILFIGLIPCCLLGLWLLSQSWPVVLLGIILSWASARSYYFLFHVLEKYVDPQLKYEGLIDLVRQIARTKKHAPRDTSTAHSENSVRRKPCSHD